jgi:hypothetical protein
MGRCERSAETASEFDKDGHQKVDKDVGAVCSSQKKIYCRVAK